MTRDGVCLYALCPTGGQPLYNAELLEAIREVDGGAPPVEWIAGEDLDPRFRSGRYVVRPILPTLRDAAGFRSRLGYAVSRLLHQVRRDRTFVSWLRSRPDIGAVHFQDTPTLFPHLLVRHVRRRGTGVLVTVHNVRRHDFPPFVPRSVVDSWSRRAYRSSDCLFVHSDGLAAELERFLAADGITTAVPPIRVVPHGVWSAETHRDPISRDAVARRLAGRRLLFFGTIRRNKGLHLLLESAARGDLAGYRLTVAGGAGEPDYVDRTIRPLVDRARAAGVAVDLRVEFVPDEEVPGLCAEHDALVLPYTEDFVAQSGVAFMGLAHGLPIVATRSGGLGELMAEHRIGVTAAAPTPTAIAEAVHELFSMSERGITELVDGMRGATGSLTWDGMATATVAEYRRILPGVPAAVPDGAVRDGTG